MKVLVGWFNPADGSLVDIPTFDGSVHPETWKPVVIEVTPEELNNILKSQMGGQE